MKYDLNICKYTLVILGMKKSYSYKWKITINNQWKESYGCQNTDEFSNCNFKSNSVGAIRFLVDASENNPVLVTDYKVAQCGDGICYPGEACETCPEDCGQCPMPICGNRVCEDYHKTHPESCESCSKDCGLCPTTPLTNKVFNLKWLLKNQNNLVG